MQEWLLNVGETVAALNLLLFQNIGDAGGGRRMFKRDVCIIGSLVLFGPICSRY